MQNQVRLNDQKQNNIYSNSMKTNRNELIRRLLTGVTGDELRNLVLVREEARRPIPAPRKIGVKQLIRYFENNPILPYRPVPAPRMKKQQPVPIPRTKIVERKRVFSGYTKSYEIKLKPTTDPLIQFQNTRLAIGRLLDTKLQEMGEGGHKFTEVLKVTFKRHKDVKFRREEQCFNSGPRIVIDAIDIGENLNLSQQKFLNGIAIWLKEGSGWVVESINGHYINIVKYNPLKGNLYIPLPPELRSGRNGLINTKNDDNECFR